MKNKRGIITLANINLNTPQEVSVEEVEVQNSLSGRTDTRYLYPRQIQLINDCGAGIEWLALESEEEYNKYIATPGDFTFIRLPKNFVLENDWISFGRCYKLIIKGYEVTANIDLTVELINYTYALLK